MSFDVQSVSLLNGNQLQQAGINPKLAAALKSALTKNYNSKPNAFNKSYVLLSNFN
jgi:hypothetical protein